MLLTTRFFDVAKFTIPKRLSLLSLCRLSFPTVCLKIFSLCTFALKSPNRIFVWYLEIDQKPALKPHTNCLFNHLFSPHLVHAHSEHDIHERPIRIIRDTLLLTNSTLLTADTVPIRIIRDTLLLTNSTLLTADTVQWCIKILLPIADFRFLLHKKNYNLLHLLCPFFPPNPLHTH